MEIREGYKRTEVGVIPKDWKLKTIDELSAVDPENLSNSTNPEYLFKYITLEDVDCGRLQNTAELLFRNAPSRARRKIRKGDILLGTVRPNLKSHLKISEEVSDWICSTGFSVIRCKDDQFESDYIYQHLFASTVNKQIDNLLSGSNYPAINSKDVKQLIIPVPPTKAEQSAIANALYDTDALITSLERLIAKKRNIKQGAMQELLKPKEGWAVKTVDDLAVCLDSLRVPLNDAQRSTMKGDYPYCGANGVLDFINEYRVDDDIILIAEDGGYFDEYSTRPIAYKMNGKCWVNNHAHILKAKENIHQDFIYHSLVHKNILRFLASGTRAKLNKSEMYKIEIDTPKEYSEQAEIATILSDIDSEINALEAKCEKYKMIKQGMMQTLLTGQIRLI